MSKTYKDNKGLKTSWTKWGELKRLREIALDNQRKVGAKPS